MSLLFANDMAGTYPPSWYAATAVPAPERPALKGHVRADVCVVGGGYTGLSAALHLARRGLDVVLLEAHRVGFGASGRNGGQVGSGQRVGQGALEKMVGRDDARALWHMGEDAKALVRELIEDEAMPGCSFHPGVVHAGWHVSDVRHSHAEAEKLARDYGYDQITPLDRAELREIVGCDGYKGGTLDHGAGHVHPLNFTLGLARAAEAAGAVLHEGSHVTRIEHGTRAIVHVASGAQVEAGHVILGCNGYLGDLAPQVARRVMPINNFILATEPLGDKAPSVLSRPVAVADSKFVVNYYRLSEDGRLLFGGGESYGYRFPDIIRTVRKPMLEVFPQLADARIDYAWGGTLAITMNRMPCLMRPRDNVLSASGYSGHGVALATLAGQILAEAVAGRSERFDVLARVPMPAFPGGTALRSPLLVLAMTWFSLRDRLGF